MNNNYSSLKGCISYSLVSIIILKLNIFLNKQTFHIHLTIIKIKKIIEKKYISLLNLKITIFKEIYLYE